MRGRFVALIGLVVALVGVAAVAVVVAMAGDDDEREGAGSSYAVLTSKDAAYAVEGADGDFEVVHDVAPADGVDAVALLPDGRLVVNAQGGGRFAATTYTLVLVDPASGDRERLPSPWTDDGSEVYPSPTVVDRDHLAITWAYRDHGERQDRVLVVDLGSGRTRQLDRPTPPLEGRQEVLGRPEPAGDGRFYFQTGRVVCGDGECSDATQGVLWSFAPGDARARKELTDVVDFAVRGELLAWTDSSEEEVHVRDLATGEEHTAPIDCGDSSLVVSPRLVVVVCLATGRHLVLDAAARPLAELRLGHEYPSVGERWVLVSEFAYDTRTGRLLRLYDAGDWSEYSPAASGDRTVVPLGVADPRAQSPLKRFDHWALVRLADRDDVVGEVGARAPAPVQCWTGRAAREMDTCGYPDGRRGMRWLFGDADADSCHETETDSARQVFAVTCPRVELADGVVVDLRFLGWGPARGMERYYDDVWLRRLAAPQRHTYAFEIASRRGAVGVLRYNGLFTDDLSVEVHADDGSELVAAIAALDLRPWREFRGRVR